MILQFILMAAGFVLLVKGGDFLVNGSASLARHFRVPELVIGLTIVSLGTSAPELLVNVISAMKGSSGIALGNVIGSNICNTLLILGAAGVVSPITVGRGTVWREIPFACFISVVLALLLNDGLFNADHADRLSRTDGLVLLTLFSLFMYYISTLARTGEEEMAVSVREIGVWMSLLFVLIGLAGLIGGGKLVVTGAVEVAAALGVSEALIGLTIVAVGTSLPELFASVMAAYRGRHDIAIGNVVGSNIFNILFVLGISSTIRDIPYPTYLNADLLLVNLSIFTVFAFMFLGKRHRIDRPEAVFLILVYIAYIGYLIARE